MNFFELKYGWGVTPRFVLHVGAHRAEELALYQKWGVKKVSWIEAQPALVTELKKRFEKDLSNEIIEAAIWDSSGIQMELKIANNGESTSLLDMELHRKFYPEIEISDVIKIRTRTLAELAPKIGEVDFLNLDIQGSELKALKGASDMLKEIKWIYLEVNEVELYSGSALVNEIDDFLSNFGFIRVVTRWWKRDGWGDALYITTGYKQKTNNFFSILVRCFFEVRWKILRQVRILLKR